MYYIYSIARMSPTMNIDYLIRRLSRSTFPVPWYSFDLYFQDIFFLKSLLYFIVVDILEGCYQFLKRETNEVYIKRGCCDSRAGIDRPIRECN